MPPSPRKTPRHLLRPYPVLAPVLLLGPLSGLPALAQPFTEPVQIWSPRTAGFDVEPGLDTQTSFGAALATGDFDDDGFADLVIGEPRGWNKTQVRSGNVYLLYGGAGGLQLPRQLVTQDFPYAPDPPEPGDGFGHAFAVGDFNADGVDDLAVGVPFETVSGQVNAGAVQVFFGSAGVGLREIGSQWFHQALPGLPSGNASEDRFGFALAAGRFNLDGPDDLAIGIPGEAGWRGAVMVLFGSPVGLTTFGARLFHQDSQDGTQAMLDEAEPFDRFGWSLAACDFDGNLLDDLAIGAHGENTNGQANAGAVAVVLSTWAGGPGLFGNQLWSQDAAGIASTAFINEWFGFSLAAADFDLDGRCDLAVGSPGDRVTTGGGFYTPGAVHVLRGSASGLTANGSTFWNEDSPGIPGETGAGENFGFALTAADFDGDAFPDLGIGAEWAYNTGAAFALFGGGGGGGGDRGITGARSRMWTPRTRSLSFAGAVVGWGARFGTGLAAGDFDGDHRNDFAVGAPGGSGGVNPGQVAVIYQVRKAEVVILQP
jgi:hypothetical protein